MSWFKKRPTPKTPPKSHPHHYSPIADKMLKEAKEKVRPSHRKPDTD